MHVANQTDRFMFRNTLLHPIFGLAACYKLSKNVLIKIIPCITDNFKLTDITQKMDCKKNKHHKINML